MTRGPYFKGEVLRMVTIPSMRFRFLRSPDRGGAYLMGLHFDVWASLAGRRVRVVADDASCPKCAIEKRGSPLYVPDEFLRRPRRVPLAALLEDY